MLTIKHISDEGNEYVTLVSEVSYTVGGCPSAAVGHEPAPATVWYREPTQAAAESPRYAVPLRPLTDGVVFVMNDKGATVAKYTLSPSPMSVIPA